VTRRELFGSLCAMVFLINLARIVFAPVIQPAAADFGVSAASLGAVTSAAWFGSAAPRIPTGYLLTRFSRSRVIGVTGLLLVGSATFTAASQSVSHLIVGAFSMGLSSGIYFIAANPLVSELFPERVGTALGIHGGASQVAAIGAPLVVSGVLLIGNWRVTFLLIAVIAAVLTVALAWAARRTALPDAGTADRSLITAGRAQWPTILTGIAFLGVTGFLWNGLFNLYGDYLTIAKGIEPGMGRLLLSVTFAAGLPAFIFGGRLADSIPNIPLLLAVTGGFAVSVFALTAVSTVYAIAAVSIVMGYLVHTLFPVVDTFLLSSLPDRHRASAYSLYSATTLSIQALGSGTVGVLVTRGVGYTVIYRAMTVGVVAVIVVMFALHRGDRLPTESGMEQAPNADAAR
jgi:Arabinose efflux permease